MVDTIGNIGSATSGGVVRASQVASPSPKADDTVIASKSLPPLSPVTGVDPISGAVITQYLSDSGEIQEQIPSNAAIAYLRVGLSANGASKDGIGDDTVLA